MLSRAARQYEDYRTQGSLASRLRRLGAFIVLLFLIYHVVTALFVRTVEVKSVSMLPTLETGDRLVVVPLVYGPRLDVFGWVVPGFREPRHGDLALVQPSYRTTLPFARRVANLFVRFFTLERIRLGASDTLAPDIVLKRIIGLPGDTVRMERFEAFVRPADERSFESEFSLSERDYAIDADPRPDAWEALDPFGAAMEDIVLGPDEYFVLSDDRPGGTDSRHWGPLSSSDIKGAATLRIWPLRAFGRP